MEFPGVAGFDDFDRDSMRFFVFVTIVFVVILLLVITLSLGFNNLGRKHSPETTLAELLVHRKVRIPELQRECLSLARRTARSPACPHLSACKFLQVIEELRFLGRMMTIRIRWKEREQCGNDGRIKGIAWIWWVKGGCSQGLV